MPEPLGQAEQAIREALDLPESLVSFLLSALKEEWTEKKEKEDECDHVFTQDYGYMGRQEEVCEKCWIVYADWIKTV